MIHKILRIWNPESYFLDLYRVFCYDITEVFLQGNKELSPARAINNKRAVRAGGTRMSTTTTAKFGLSAALTGLVALGSSFAAHADVKDCLPLPADQKRACLLEEAGKMRERNHEKVAMLNARIDARNGRIGDREERIADRKAENQVLAEEIAEHANNVAAADKRLGEIDSRVAEIDRALGL